MVRVNVRFSLAFRDATGTTTTTLDVRGGTIKDLINTLIREFGPSFQERILDPKTGWIRRFVNAFVNGRDIRNLQGAETKLAEGDEVRFIPAVAGGNFFGFTQDQLVRYSRQIILREVGGQGQKKLMRSSVLVVGAGGLGSPAALYLAAAGVGKIGIIDCDKVDLSNLQRQLLHETKDIGRPKIESAKEKLLAVNPEIKVVDYNEKLGVDNVFDIIQGWDFVVDGSDNFPTKFLLNDACVVKNVPLSHGGILRFVGMTMTILTESGPCYRCFAPEAPPPGMVPSCQESGVLGSVAGVVGSLQATEALKYLLGVGDLLVGRLVLFDALEMHFEEFEVRRNPNCPVCGDHPIIKNLSQVDYGHVCEVRFS